MRPMSEAPRDGTRFLAKKPCFYFDGWDRPWKQQGTQIVEVFHDGEKFREWLGTSQIQSTANTDYLGWAPIPDGLNDSVNRRLK